MKEVHPEKGLEGGVEITGELQTSELRASEDLDPLSPNNVLQVSAITQFRIYDLLGAILTHLDKDQADAILALHAQGKLAGPPPYISENPYEQ